MSNTIKRCGVVAQKLGMTTFFKDSGEAWPITLFSLEGCCVIGRGDETTGHTSVQVGSGEYKKSNKPLRGHFAKAGVSQRRVLAEFRVSPEFELQSGDVFRADYFSEGNHVDVAGVTKGRGFAGCMKRWNFKGLRASHGVSVSHRSHGSTGHRKDPGKVFKNKKMAGHLGTEQITMQNLKVAFVDVERGLIGIKGSVPGFEGSWVKIRDAVKKPLSQMDKTFGVVGVK